MAKRLAVALSAVGAVAILGGGAAYYFTVDHGPSLCAVRYAETGDEQYQHASWWTCYRASRRARADGPSLFSTLAANAAAEARRAVTSAEKARQEAALIAELRQPVCAALGLRRSRSGYPADKPFDLDLLGLSGHSSLFSVEVVCRNCADEMSTLYDADGQRFCAVGGVAGQRCEAANAFPHTGSIHREATLAELQRQLNCP